ncbi:hypothetical protein [Streptococcus macacae]|uniref:Uncharacterized protein n=1 Tax=Streptococcus macacae NCTC 11558 TaxID=764298 RepID=G5JXA1_9STRE|nr:hypothetical protein [Streptococcus macacae]EHJ52849.1 hypothetical protein STRMA_1970 [Streptococcus macacae NCTC 11558]SUN77875.1 Uncharacterised protein [Streptococcus macacae NCTC 11558]
MEIRSKKLSLYQLFGYKESGLTAVPIDQLCQEVYPLCWEFIEDMLDTVYSDGPVCFKSYPFSQAGNWLIFTTFGNEIRPTSDDVYPLYFEDKLFIESEDFASFRSADLQDYYDDLAAKYADRDLSSLAVYHVLYHPSAEGIWVDAYSSWEEV